MINIPKIYTGFYKIQSDDYYGIIEFYENKSVYFDNKKTFNDYEDFICFSQVAALYVISLEKKGRYRNTIEYVDKFISVFNEQFKNYEIIKNDFDAYWSILTSQGRALYEMKEYKRATIVFKNLVDRDKKNDYLKNWLDASKQGRRKSLNIYVNILAVLLFLVSIIIENKQISKSLLILGFSIFFISLVYEYLLDKFLHWIRKK